MGVRFFKGRLLGIGRIGGIGIIGDIGGIGGGRWGLGLKSGGIMLIFVCDNKLKKKVCSLL